MSVHRQDCNRSGAGQKRTRVTVRTRADLDETVLKQMNEYIRKVLTTVECPKHHKSPDIEIRGLVVISLKVQVCGCCSDFCHATERVLDQ
jgi:hypothetical protein